MLAKHQKNSTIRMLPIVGAMVSLLISVLWELIKDDKNVEALDRFR
jgi:hypothetical protein